MKAVETKAKTKKSEASRKKKRKAEYHAPGDEPGSSLGRGIKRRRAVASAVFPSAEYEAFEHGAVECQPGQKTFWIRDATGRWTLEGDRDRAFAHLHSSGGFLFQKQRDPHSYMAVHVGGFEDFVAIARRGGHVYSLIGQHDTMVYVVIDAKKIEMEAVNTDHDGVLSRSMRGLRTFFHEWYGLAVTSTDFYCAQACAAEQASWHLHLHRTFSAEEREVFRTNLIHAKRSDPNLAFVDVSPYTTTCSLRCIGSREVGTDRVLMACPKWGDFVFAYKERAKYTASLVDNAATGDAGAGGAGGAMSGTATGKAAAGAKAHKRKQQREKQKENKRSLRRLLLVPRREAKAWWSRHTKLVHQLEKVYTDAFPNVDGAAVDLEIDTNGWWAEGGRYIFDFLVLFVRGRGEATDLLGFRTIQWDGDAEYWHLASDCVANDWIGNGLGRQQLGMLHRELTKLELSPEYRERLGVSGPRAASMHAQVYHASVAILRLYQNYRTMEVHARLPENLAFEETCVRGNKGEKPHSHFVFRSPGQREGATRVENGITITDRIDIADYLPNNPHIVATAPSLIAIKRAVIKGTRTVLRRRAPRVKVDMVEAVCTRIITAVRAYGDKHSAIAEWNGRTAIIRSSNRICYHCDDDTPRVHQSNGACIRLETDGRLRYRCFSSKCPNTYVTIDAGTNDGYFEAQTLVGADGIARFFAVEADEIYDSEKDQVFREDTGAPCTRVLDLVKHPIIMLREGLGMGKTKQTVDAIHTPIETRFCEITRPSIAWGHHRISLGKDVLNSYNLRTEQVGRYPEHIAAVNIQRAWRRYTSPSPEPVEGEWATSESASHPIIDSWGHYQDPGVFKAPHRIMCQIDSFYRFQPRSANDSYTPHVLVLDELHDLLRQLVGSRARVDNWRQLLRMARGAHRIVCMDGLGDELAHKFFEAVGRVVHWRENVYKPHRGVEHRFVHWTVGHAHIINSLEAGKKLFIPCASKSHLISLEEDIIHEGYTCVSLHGDTPQDQRKRMFANLSDETRDCDVFLMSPTITSGCSIDHAHFDETVFVLSTRSVVADAVWQMVWRVRHLKSQKVTYMCDNTVVGGVYYSESHTANRLRNPTRLKELVLQRSRETDATARHVSSQELRELNAMAFESDALRSKDSLWPIILHVANEQDNRRFEMLQRLYDIIENSGGVLHRLPKVAKEGRDKVRTNRVDKSALWGALSTADDVDQELYKTIRRLRNRGEATQRQQHEIQRYELRVAFGEAMPDEPSAKWFATYHNRADQFRRLSMLGCYTDTVQQAHASRIRIARSAERVSRESHASCNMTDGDLLVVATELLRAGGFKGPLDKATLTKADLVSRLPAMHAVITGWSSARRGALIKTKPTLSVMINSARGILGQSLGVSIANVGTRKTPIYAVAGFHEWPIPKFKSGRAKKVSFKPPLWNVIRGRITTRCYTEFQALSDAQDISATTYDGNKRQRKRGDATEVQKYEITRYELRAAFGKAMPTAPSAAWFKTYHNKTDQYRRISLLDGSATLERAHAVRSRMAVKTKLGRETSHANCSMTDGDWIVCAVELIQSMGFANHLDTSTISKADVLARLESTQSIVAGWNSARKRVSASGSRSLCTTIKAVKGILEAAIGVYITNVGTKKKPRYGIVGVYERDAPRFKSGRKKHTKSKPPIWNLDGSDITTRCDDEDDDHRQLRVIDGERHAPLSDVLIRCSESEKSSPTSESPEAGMPVAAAVSEKRERAACTVKRRRQRLVRQLEELDAAVKDPSGRAYVIRAGTSDYYKIGCSRVSAESRASTGQTYHEQPLRVVWDGAWVPNMFAAESALHDRFAASRSQLGGGSEWFHFPNGLPDGL